MAQRGRFITLEGGEGVGKSTLAAALRAELSARGIDVLLTREPGGTPEAEALRGVILTPPQGVDHWQPATETLLFYAARYEHLQGKIRPALAAGKWVICDRFSDSTRAYQSAAGGVADAAIDDLERHFIAPTRPDLTLVLDLPVEQGFARVASRGNKVDAIESRRHSYHEAVRAAFLAIAKREPERCSVLDASADAATLAAKAMAVIDERLGVAP